MPPMGYASDPLLGSYSWKLIRKAWRDKGLPCSKCGCRINYTSGYKGIDAFEVGHIVGRDQARAMQWTDAQINSIGNTRPECRQCNRRDGARYMHSKKNARNSKRNRVPIESDEW